jgi:hypothetical protein
MQSFANGRTKGKYWKGNSVFMQNNFPSGTRNAVFSTPVKTASFVTVSANSHIDSSAKFVSALQSAVNPINRSTVMQHPVADLAFFF